MTVIVASDDPARLDAALTLANAHAALGAGARVYLHDRAVAAAMPPDLYAVAIELGVTFVACQTALETHHVALPAGWEGGGMIGLVAELGDARLVIA